MARAFVVLALLIVACAVARAEQAASPAKDLEKALNVLEDTLLTPTVQQDLDAGDAETAAEYAEHAKALASGGAEWAEGTNPHKLSLAETSVSTEAEAEVDVDAGVGTGANAAAAAAGPNEGVFANNLKNLVKQGLISSGVGQRIIQMSKARKCKAGELIDPKTDKCVAAIIKGKGKGKGKGKAKAAAAPPSGETPPSNVVGANGKPLESLKLVTGPSGFGNSQCFACQYFLQRTLGALLGAYYGPKAAGPAIPDKYTPPRLKHEVTATPENKWKQYVGTDVAFEALDRSKEAEKKYNARFTGIPTDRLFIPSEAYILAEVDSTATSPAPLTSFLEAAVQIGKADVDAAAEESTSEEQSQSEGERLQKKKKKHHKKGKGNGKGPAKPKFPKSDSLESDYGPLYARYQNHGVNAFFSDLCNRRVPDEWQSTCRTLYKNLAAITEELTVGDRPDEICMRHGICSSTSYLAKLPHTAVRNADPNAKAAGGAKKA